MCLPKRTVIWDLNQLRVPARHSAAGLGCISRPAAGAPALEAPEGLSLSRACCLTLRVPVGREGKQPEGSPDRVSSSPTRRGLLASSHLVEHVASSWHVGTSPEPGSPRLQALCGASSAGRLLGGLWGGRGWHPGPDCRLCDT